MPLTEKGKKLKEKFRGQYGKKKGDSIFYAMENSGKLKKVMKAQYGGGADAGGKKSPGKGTYKSPSANPFEVKNRPGGNGGNQNILTTIKNKASAVAQTGKNFAIGTIPFTPFGFAVKGLESVENMRRKKRAKGEFFTSKKKIDPITREFYRTNKRPLDTTIGGKDEDYLKAAGIIGFGGPPKNMMDAGPKTPLCPDGTEPPCPPIVQPTKPNVAGTFLKGFQKYNSGGVNSGPPPKRGPNPQVPPIKMREGKMTKKYKMSCPHRPDGIRGVGASIRGHKFIGVK
jgi:hypothetical protein